MTIFTSHHKVITSSRLLQTRLLHQGVSRLLRHDDVGQSQNVSKSADFRCEKMHFCSSESRESSIFGISALKTIVLKNKTKLFFNLQLVNCSFETVLRFYPLLLVAVQVRSALALAVWLRRADPCPVAALGFVGEWNLWARRNVLSR